MEKIKNSEVNELCSLIARKDLETERQYTLRNEFRRLQLWRNRALKRMNRRQMAALIRRLDKLR